VGHKKELIELGTKPTAQQEINKYFRHSTHIFERIEEFEIEEFQSSQMNRFKNEIQKAVYKHNTCVQTRCLISLTLNVEQKKEHRKQL